MASLRRGVHKKNNSRSKGHLDHPTAFGRRSPEAEFTEKERFSGRRLIGRGDGGERSKERRGEKGKHRGARSTPGRARDADKEGGERQSLPVEEARGSQRAYSLTSPASC